MKDKVQEHLLPTMTLHTKFPFIRALSSFSHLCGDSLWLSGLSVLQASIKAAVTGSTISQMTTTTTQTALNICSVSVSRSSFLSGFVNSGSSLRANHMSWDNPVWSRPVFLHFIWTETVHRLAEEWNVLRPAQMKLLRDKVKTWSGNWKLTAATFLCFAEGEEARVCF